MTTREQDLQKLSELKKQQVEITKEKMKTNEYFWRTKAYKEIRSQIGKLTYKLNKDANVYYHEDMWIYDLHSEIRKHKPKNITGNALTDWFANEYNKIDGVMVERHYENDSVYYILSVLTMKQIYTYFIARGYDKEVSIERVKGNCGNRFVPYFTAVEHHICEMVLGDTLENLNGNKDLGRENITILDKPLHI